MVGGEAANFPPASLAKVAFCTGDGVRVVGPDADGTVQFAGKATLTANSAAVPRAPRRKVASVALPPPPCYVPPPRRQVPRDMSFTKCLIILPASYGCEPLQCSYDLKYFQF